MAALCSGQWITFFLQAGIPDKAAATYALTFAENRIQMNMLLDLNKEYLRDMGITLMGDVIAILRHARAKHDEIAREKLLVTSDREKPSVMSKAVEVAPITISKNVAKAKKPLSAPRVTEHYSRDAPAPASAPKLKPKVSTKELDVSTGGTCSRKVSITKPEVAAPPKSKSRPSFSTLETITIEDDPPLKKIRRVAPEEEGGYKIKMPSGSTPRSQEILEKSKELARRRNVFQRLGKETASTLSNGTRSPPSAPAVSSTTGASGSASSLAISSLSAGPSKKIVKPTGKTSGFPAKSRSTSSVFRRLGDKQVSSSTSNVAKRENALPYAGILKPTDKISKRTVTQKPVEAVTMVADSVESARTEVRERLGSVLRTASNNEFSSKVERKKITPESSKVGVRLRFGEYKLVSDKVERESTVKERLKISSVKNIARTSPYSSTSETYEENKQHNRGVFSRLGM